MSKQYDQYGRRFVWRTICCSGRRIRTIEWRTEPDVFYIPRGGTSVGGPFPLNDKRFTDASPNS